MGSRPFYYPITDELRHSVATMVAAGLTTNYIITKLTVSLAGVRAIKAEAGWQELLESKQIALTRLMRG